MKSMKKWLAVLLALACMTGCAWAESMDQVRGFDPNAKYQYVLLGTYPYEKDGKEAPLLWRILGREGDIIHLFTEDIIDNIQVMFVDNYQDAVKKKKFRKVETFEETDLYAWVNSVMTDTILKYQDFSYAIVEDHGGKFHVMDNSEMRRTDWGFPNSTMGNTIEQEGETIAKNAVYRKGYGTPYARAKILYPDWKNTTNRNWNKLFQFTEYGGSSPYWTAKIRSGQRWCGLVGGNGHLSWGGQGDVQKGIRPGLVLDLSRLNIVGGSGTLKDPWIMEPSDGSAPAITNMSAVKRSEDHGD